MWPRSTCRDVKLAVTRCWDFHVQAILERLHTQLSASSGTVRSAGDPSELELERLASLTCYALGAGITMQASNCDIGLPGSILMLTGLIGVNDLILFAWPDVIVQLEVTLPVLCCAVLLFITRANIVTESCSGSQ